MIMKTLVLTATLVATVLASALTAQAASRQVPFDGYKFFDDIASRGGQ
jgi:hypothetical protein